MVQSVDLLIAEIRSRVHSLLYDEVIQHTIVVMRELSTSLNQLAGLIKDDASCLTDDQKGELQAILLPLASESIREALHKGELSITNRIIKTKNRILAAVGARIPEGHEEINPNDYPNYNW